MVPPKRPHTLFIEEDEGVNIPTVTTSSADGEKSGASSRTKLIKRTHGERLVDVKTGSPWIDYDKRTRVKYWCSFGLITSKATRDMFMIRTIANPAESMLADLCRLRHQNIVRISEIYCLHDSHYLISEFMATSLLNIHRSPTYPTEPQLGSLLYQVG